MEYEEIQKRIKLIVDNPVKGFSDEEMAKVRKKIAEKCPKSKPLYEEFQKLIPGGTHHQLVIKDLYTITMKRTLGNRMWDLEDKQYIDYLMSA